MVAPALLQEDVVRTSAAPDECFVILDDGLGHQDPIRLRPEYATGDKAEYAFLKRTPLPRRELELAAKKSSDSSEAGPSTAWQAARRSGGSKRRQELLHWLLELKRKQEKPLELTGGTATA